MGEAEARPAAVHDRAPCDGAATVRGKQETPPVETDNAEERGAPRRAEAVALLRLADAGAVGATARTGGRPC